MERKHFSVLAAGLYTGKMIRDGVDCGILDIEWCPSCGQEYFPEESMERIKKH